jgi:hypothetical protein
MASDLYVVDEVHNDKEKVDEEPPARSLKKADKKTV